MDDQDDEGNGMRRAWIQLCAAATVAACTAAPCAVAIAGAAEQAAAGIVSAAAAATRFARHDVFTMASGAGAHRYYLMTPSGGDVTTMTARGRLPWTVDVDYALNGPNVDMSALDGADGTVQIHLHIAPDQQADGAARRYARQLRLFAAFTMPANGAKDVSADDGAAVERHGDTIVVSSTAAPGKPLDMRVFVEATKFSMGDIAVAALSADSPAAYGDGLRALGAQSATLTEAVNKAGRSSDGSDDGANAAFLATLTQLRDQERTLAKQRIAELKKAHQRAFHDYMAAYVGSYTNHLSGSIGTKTQMTALMGTAGELKGETPLARAVTGLATAVNNVSDAYQHVGAADEVDRIITRIRQQGTSGLTEDLRQTAGEQARIGAQMYSDGQGQLSRAMIPYSMAYTDVYTSELNDLTGGDLARAGACKAEAIAATNARNGSGTLGDDMAGVDAAMATLASAREHTGAANAAEQILQRFPGELGGDDASGSGADIRMQLQPVLRDSPLMRAAYEQWLDDPLGGQARARRAARIADAEKRQQAAHGPKDMSTLVTPSSNDASAEISKYAGSVTKSIGGGGSSDAEDSGKSGKTGGDAQRQVSKEISEDGWMALVDANPWERAFIAADTQPFIDEAVRIASARTALDLTADGLAKGGALADEVAKAPMRAGTGDVLDTRFLIVHGTR